MTVELPTETWLWRLKPEGTCGVGDYTRGLSRNLNMRILDHSKGERPSGAPVLVHWVPSAWSELLGWYGPMVDTVRRAQPRRTVVFFHELWRGLGGRRGWYQHPHDLLGLRVLLARAQQAVVTTGSRKRQLERALHAWGIHIPVDVAFVPSTVHAADPVAPMPVPDGPPTLALFARAGGGVLADALAHTVALILERAPNTRVLMLGERGDPARDAVTRALDKHNVLDRVETTGMLPPDGVVAALGQAHVGLSLHDTGVAGRRTTVSAMLACGLPVVAADGIETDEVWRHSPALVLPTRAHQPDAGALASAVLNALQASHAEQWTTRTAALAFYRQQQSWNVLRDALDQPGRVGPQDAAA